MDAATSKRMLLPPLSAGSSAEGWSILRQGMNAPVLRGTDPGGADLICGLCREVVLAESIQDGQLWNLALQCRCGGVSAGPRLPIGTTLPERVVIFPPGIREVRSTWTVVPHLVLTGLSAAPDRGASAGEPLVSAAGKGLLTSAVLRATVERLRTLFGPDIDKLVEIDRRRAAKRVPWRDRHRLVMNLERVQLSAEWLESGESRADVPCITELLATVDLFERWRDHPAWRGLARSLKNRTDYAHGLITLATASWLRDHGNTLELASGNDERLRSADLRLSVVEHGDVSLEVKTPQALQNRETRLSLKEADQIVRDALKSAGTGVGGQLPPDKPGVLVLGGLHLTRRDLETLKEAARKVFRGYPDKRRHIAGILVADLGQYVREVSLDPAGARIANGPFGAVFSCRLIANPSYVGPQVLETVIDTGAADPLDSLAEHVMPGVPVSR